MSTHLDLVLDLEIFHCSNDCDTIHVKYNYTFTITIINKIVKVWVNGTSQYLLEKELTFEIEDEYLMYFTIDLIKMSFFSENFNFLKISKF